MHEYGVAAEIVRMVSDRAGGRVIIKVNLQVGDLSGVFCDSLAMYCDLLFRDLQPDPAVEVAITRVAAAFECSCGTHYTPAAVLDPCPSCNGYERTVTGGDQCRIESIEVEDD
jgi:Zn finger protein HypA/HybF involved in hydrogenase expression